MSDTPRFLHHCPGCVFLGHHDKHDLYFCPQGGHPTVMARFDNDDPDYKSGLVLAGADPHLHEAYERAKAKRLLVPHPKVEAQWDELLAHNERFGKGSF